MVQNVPGLTIDPSLRNAIRTCPSKIPESKNLTSDSIFLPVLLLSTLKVESFAGRNFGGDKLSRTLMVKIKFRGYKLSRMPSIFALFLYFRTVFIKF